MTNKYWLAQFVSLAFQMKMIRVKSAMNFLTDFQRHGIMKEAVEKVIDYAFDIIKVQKIEAFFHRDNQRSIKLLEKFSFRDSNERDKTDPALICYYLTKSIDNLK